MISDFKKPIKEDSQRMLLAVALEDTKAFQNTLTRLFEITGPLPETRVSGHHDLRLRRQPAQPNAAGQCPGLKGPISFAVAKETFFVTTDTTLLEQVLRPGNATLADSTDVPDRSPRRSPRRPAA